MILDVRTMGIVSAVTPFILGSMMLIYLRKRKSYAGFGQWVLADFCLGTGYLLVSLRGYIPDFFSIILGNITIVYSVLLIYEGIQRFYDRRVFSWPNTTIFVVYILVQSYYTYFEPDTKARIIVSSLVLSILIGHAGVRLLDTSISGLQETSRSAAYLFIVTALFPFVRALFAFFQSGPLDFFSDVLNSWFSIVFIISIVSWTFYFFFLNSARLELDLELAKRKLEQVARTDTLTNSYNRRYFDEQAEAEFRVAQRYKRNLAFLIIDADHFKKINDTSGHEAGDKVLHSLSRIIESEVRSLDMVARYGGDEFIVMLLDADIGKACSVAERIRYAAQAAPITGSFGELSMTVSIGVSTMQAADTDLAMTLRRADTALYAAKAQGRNQVVKA